MISRQLVKNGDNDRTPLTLFIYLFRTLSLLVLTPLFPMTKFSSGRDCAGFICTIAFYVFKRVKQNRLKLPRAHPGQGWGKEILVLGPKLFHVCSTLWGVEFLLVNTCCFNNVSSFLHNQNSYDELPK